MTDIVAAARAFLASQQEIYTVLGSDEIWDLWLFQETLYTRVESTQKTACVLKLANGWTAPNAHNTLRFPRLQTDFYADPDRDLGDNNKAPLSAKDKILAAHAVVDRFLHDTVNSEIWWPDINSPYAARIIRSVRQGELEFNPFSDGDGMQKATVFYAIGLAN